MNLAGTMATKRAGLGRRRWPAAFLAAFAACAAAFAISSAPAPAYENIEPGFNFFEVTPSTPQAGGHPDVEITFSVRSDDEQECESNCLYPRRYLIHWPEGFIGNPHVAPKCSISELSIQACPVDSQIGKFVIFLGEQGLYTPVYNMETRPDQAGLLGFTAPLLSVPIFFELSSRTDGDYGLEATTTPLLRLPFPQFKTVLWGVPASPANDVDRFFSPLTGVGACYIGIFGPEIVGCPPGLPFVSSTYAPSTSPEAPFLQNPTTCGTELSMSAEVEYYGGAFGRTEIAWPKPTGCAQASFNPSLTAKPTTEATDTPTGADAELRVPQTQSPITPSPSQLRTARILLPEGFSLNPSAAVGKVLCPASASGIGTLLPAACPEHAKIGTLMLDVSALPGPIPGALYLTESLPGKRFRVLLTASGFATHVKLLGHLETNPANGQVTLVFEDLPQSPLQEFDLHIFGSERGALATPDRCGVYEVRSEFVPWNSALQPRHTLSTITLTSGPNGSPCPSGPRPFAPSVAAGSERNTAGAYSPFSFSVSRPDGDQNVSSITVKTPPGFAARLAGVPYCPEDAIASIDAAGRTGHMERAASACPAASEIGNAVAAAGAGSHPVQAPGKVYLAGPYKGAPLSLVVVVPAIAGPYDLGNVVLRAAVHVNPANVQVTAVSDPLPQIREGVPLRARNILINLDRPGFAINPTNCSEQQVESTLGGTDGANLAIGTHYQVANCADLAFAPKLNLKLSGSMKRRGNPAIRAVLRMDPEEANARRVTVVMPKFLLLDNSHIDNVCTRQAFATDSCPPGSRIGRAVAHTPLLDQPLRGDVYLRSSNNQLPDVVMDLEGQIDVELSGRVFSGKGGRLGTAFETIPDAPVSRFVLDLQGGRKGLLVNSRHLCKGPARATVRVAGQNGVRETRRTRLQTACGKARKRQGHVRRGSRG